MKKITLVKIDQDEQDIDDDQMTDDEMLLGQQKQCLKELKVSIEAFMGKHKYKKGKRFRKLNIPLVSTEKKQQMVFNYKNAEILKGVIVPVDF